MGVGIGASGFVGVALETLEDPGLYVEPTKFFPIRSESLAATQDTVWRRVIRGNVASPLGAVPGNQAVGGDIEIEALPDVLPYFLLCARGDITKSGSSPYSYLFTPNAKPLPKHTMSITIVRNDVVFTYTGVCVTGMEFTVDGGIFVTRFSVLGQTESEEDAPTPTWANQAPFGAGEYDVQIPTGSSSYELDGFTFNVDDGGEAQYRLRNDRRSPSYIRYGERSVTLGTNLDFDDRADFDNFLALTSNDVTLVAGQSASTNRKVTIRMPAMIIDTYDLGLSGQGDIVQAAVSYQGVWNGVVGADYLITILTTENITIPVPE